MENHWKTIGNQRDVNKRKGNGRSWMELVKMKATLLETTLTSDQSNLDIDSSNPHGFYTELRPWGQVARSRVLHPGQNMANFIRLCTDAISRLVCPICVEFVVCNR